jgi:hypothetical protein
VVVVVVRTDQQDVTPYDRITAIRILHEKGW